MFRNSLSALTEENEEVELTLEEWEALEPRRPDAAQAPAAEARRPAERGRREAAESSAPEGDEAVVDLPPEDDFAPLPDAGEEKPGADPAEPAPQRRGRKHRAPHNAEIARHAAHAGHGAAGSPARKDGRHGSHAAHAPHAADQSRKA